MNEKYVKQMSLKEIGEEGQRKIINSSITIIGMGGLGCSVFMYLARMGVTNFKIIDYDIVETSNCQDKFCIMKIVLENIK